MFIKLTAAFHPHDEPDYEALNIKPAQDDFTKCIWDDLHIGCDNIVSMNVTESAFTNIELVGGFVWCVKESPEDIKMLCNVERHVEHSQRYALNHPEKV